MKTRSSILLTLSVAFLSCQPQETATAPSEGNTRTVAARIAAGSVSSDIWKTTDSVTLKAVTTANGTLLDTGFSLAGKTGVLHLKSVEVRSDLGITMTAKGYIGGILLWEGTAMGEASAQDQTLAMMVTLADRVDVGSGQSKGTVNAPTIDSIHTLGGKVDGVYDEPLRVYLSTQTDSAVIFYTINGMNPTIASSKYSDTGLIIDSSCTLKAMAARKNYTSSTLHSQVFILQASAPVISASERDGWPPYKIGLSTTTQDAVIRYTSNGRTPTSSDSIYSDSLVFPDGADTMTIKAAVFPRKLGVKSSVVTTRGFSVAAPWNKSISYGKLVDARDNQTYKTVKIGSQTWMAQNLNYKPKEFDSSMCYDNMNYNCERFGRLYSWTTIMDSRESGVSGGIKGLCPQGWHLPSISDWQNLVKFVELDSRVGVGNSGSSLQAVDSRLPLENRVGTSDYYGFRALHALLINGVSTASPTGYWWSSAETKDSLAWVITLNPNGAYNDFIDVWKGQKYYARCLSD